MVTIDTISERSDSGSLPNVFGGAGKHQGRGRAIRVSRAIGGLVSGLALWYRKRRSRRELADLDRHLLRDVGITPHEARAELRKSLYLF